jgi:hypothetical protein
MSAIICSEAKAAALVTDHGLHPEVGIRGEAPVEPDLLMAVEASLLKAGKVQEAQVEGLLELVHQLAGQKDVRDVRLDMLHLLGAVRVEARLAKAGDELVLIHC